MREIVHLQAGQCGALCGEKFVIDIELAITSTGHVHGRPWFWDGAAVNGEIKMLLIAEPKWFVDTVCFQLMWLYYISCPSVSLLGDESHSCIVSFTGSSSTQTNNTHPLLLSLFQPTMANQFSPRTNTR
eukprot:scaffold61753_cov54-Cyclotella_meneghiniana.AAC.3